MITPPYLSKGDKVTVVAPASAVNKNQILKGVETLKSWGLAVHMGKHVFDSYGQFSADDQCRTEDFQLALNDPECKAIIMARGGYGTTRILDRIDFHPLMAAPKWLVGFSDITALHAHLTNLGITSLHGPMPGYYFAPEHLPAAMRLYNHLFGTLQEISAGPHPYNRPGEIRGRTIGGNLAILCHIIGSPSDMDYRGKILCLEDTGEYLYNIDRMMVQLKRSGKLAEIAGMVVGQFSDLKDTRRPFGKDAYQIISEAVERYDYPVAYNFPFGHIDDNFCFQIGAEMNLRVPINRPSTWAYIHSEDKASQQAS